MEGEGGCQFVDDEEDGGWNVAHVLRFGAPVLGTRFHGLSCFVEFMLVS